jgi:hypothetical protein
MLRVYNIFINKFFIIQIWQFSLLYMGHFCDLLHMNSGKLLFHVTLNLKTGISWKKTLGLSLFQQQQDS